MAVKNLTIEGEPAKRFAVKWGLDIQHFDTAAEVLEATKRADRTYEIWDQRRPIKRTEVKD